MDKKRFPLTLCAVLIIFAVTATSLAEGLFPSFTNLFTTLPSMSAIVKRAPDSQEQLPDGGRRVTFKGVTSADFDAFSRYIGEYGCEIKGYSNDNGAFKADLRYKDADFTFEYMFAEARAVLVYPSGTAEEYVELATPTPVPTPRPTAQPTRTPSPTPRRTATPRPTATPRQGVSLVVLDENSTGFHWISSRRMGIQVRVKNTHQSKTVHDYEIISYTCDEFGNQNSAKNVISFSKKVKPYETVETPDIPLTNPYNEIYYIYIAVKSVRYTDGTVESTDNPEYHQWNVNHR